MQSFDWLVAELRTRRDAEFVIIGEAAYREHEALITDVNSGFDDRLSHMVGILAGSSQPERWAKVRVRGQRYDTLCDLHGWSRGGECPHPDCAFLAVHAR